MYDKKTIVLSVINFFKDKTIEKTGLRFQNNYQLLISIVLSARCKDAKVNDITPDLFDKFPDFTSLAKADVDEIQYLIKSITYPNEKAKRLKKLGCIMVEKFNNEIPNDLETLITLPGVGRKTANVYLATVYDLPCIAVDTHVKRISNRLQLVNSNNPVEIEMELYKLFPKEFHNRVSSWFIYFGRNRCKAIKPSCDDCPFKIFCIKHKKN